MHYLNLLSKYSRNLKKLKNFGFSFNYLIFRFFPKYYIYTMENYKHLFEENIVEYFKENLIYEFLNNNKIKFYIPEQIKEIDNYFIENMIQYKK